VAPTIPPPIAVRATPLTTKPGRVIRKSPPPGVENPNAVKPETNTVEFKVADGFAVAYGDIVLGKPEESDVQHGYAEVPIPQPWDKPDIPYWIQPDLPNPERVHQALNYFQKHTTVNFIAYDAQQDAIVFERGSNHCYSLLGKQGGLQPINLADNCQWGEIVHELMHALGFVHEQSRTDRDRYLEILWPNIQPDFRSQYAIVPDNFMENEKDTPFDYQSTMLYSPDVFASTPGNATMRTRTGNAIAPVREGLSPGDIQRLQRVYRR
jgi:hypothetical protein